MRRHFLEIYISLLFSHILYMLFCYILYFPFQFMMPVTRRDELVYLLIADEHSSPVTAHTQHLKKKK